MSYRFNCKECGKPTQLLSRYCEECHVKTSGILRTRYAERPKCREAIERLLKNTPDLTLFQIAFWTEFDTVPIIPSEGLKIQARKMLQEKWKNEQNTS